MISPQELIRHIDIEYSYGLAKRMEEYRSNPVLGYRPAGSRAEFETGEMLKAEMEHLGLSQVRKDAIQVDGWEFHKAVLHFCSLDGSLQTCQLGAYQTTLVTDGPKTCSMVYLGKGTAKDYDNRDVNGKLVLVDINQRDEWWINYPVYQAHLKGALALIAVQDGGYGEIDDEALNAQDIAGPANAPAFSISRKDARELKKLFAVREEIPVQIDCDTRVMSDCTTYNITGRIPGRHPDRIVLLSAHYDSYFSGFQDDNTAVAMMFGIAKAFLDSGYRPENTILLCAMAAEEWGVTDSNFDWSTGAYEQVFTAHPEWVGKVIADLNFELPALAHGTRARIRSCYEYTDFLEDYLYRLPLLTQAYPEETAITAPIETWSDDFSMAIAGIPSMVNDFTGGSFMETHYHSQFDNDTYFDPAVYRLHHELFSLLILSLDQTAVVPLNFTGLLQKGAAGCVVENPEASGLSEELSAALSKLRTVFLAAAEREKQNYERVVKINREYEQLDPAGRAVEPDKASDSREPLDDRESLDEAHSFYLKYRDLEKGLLRKFKAEQDAYVRIDWHGNVLFPHVIFLQNIKLLHGACKNLKEGELSAALRKLYRVDNNAYAFMFDREVYRHFTEYTYLQPKNRLKWGYKRHPGHENLYDLVKTLLEKQKQKDTDYSQEITCLEAVCKKQQTLLADAIRELILATEEIFR